MNKPPEPLNSAERAEIQDALDSTPERYTKPEGGSVHTYEPTVSLRRSLVVSLLSSLATAERERDEAREAQKGAEAARDLYKSTNATMARMHDAAFARVFEENKALRVLLPRLVEQTADMQSVADLKALNDYHGGEEARLVVEAAHRVTFDEVIDALKEEGEDGKTS